VLLYVRRHAGEGHCETGIQEGQDLVQAFSRQALTRHRPPPPYDRDALPRTSKWKWNCRMGSGLVRGIVQSSATGTPVVRGKCTRRSLSRAFHL